MQYLRLGWLTRLFLQRNIKIAFNSKFILQCIYLQKAVLFSCQSWVFFLPKYSANLNTCFHDQVYLDLNELCHLNSLILLSVIIVVWLCYGSYLKWSSPNFVDLESVMYTNTQGFRAYIFRWALQNIIVGICCALWRTFWNKIQVSNEYVGDKHS